MNRETFERAIHLWPEWAESIAESRQLLGYGAKWSHEECIKWIEQHYPDIRDQGKAELKRLGLPPVLQQYWEDCFYSDYQADDGTINFGKITRRLSDRKSLPELPCDFGLVWYDDEDVHEHWLRIEIRLHAAFATKDLLDYAVKYAYETVRDHLWSEGVKPHPIGDLVKRSKVRPQEEKRSGLRRFDNGEVDFVGLLREQWQHSDVQTRLEEYRMVHAKNPKKVAQKERELAKEVYGRVAGWFYSTGRNPPRIEQRGGWRKS